MEASLSIVRANVIYGKGAVLTTNDVQVLDAYSDHPNSDQTSEGRDSTVIKREEMCEVTSEVEGNGEDGSKGGHEVTLGDEVGCGGDGSGSADSGGSGDDSDKSELGTGSQRVMDEDIVCVCDLCSHEREPSSSRRRDRRRSMSTSERIEGE